MAEKRYQPGENYQYPLIIKKLLATPLRESPDRKREDIIQINGRSMLLMVLCPHAVTVRLQVSMPMFLTFMRSI